jgi:presqualene diphosphate synthase
MQMNVQLAPSGPSQVKGSSFYAAMRVLPQQQRDAMFAIYGFCRAVDDVADGESPRAMRLAELGRWRAEVDALFAGAPPPRLRALIEPVRKFGLARDDFQCVIDGVTMDAAADIRAPDLATLDLYCDRVACAVGRLSVRVFGMPTSDGALLASHLGRALQLTNILRDLDVDADRGRLYLPREILVAQGIDDTDPRKVLDHPKLGCGCSVVAAEARGHFSAAGRVMARYPLRIVRAPLLMAKVYQNLLDRLQRRGWAPRRRPVHTNRFTLLWILLRHGLIRTERRP